MSAAPTLDECLGAALLARARVAFVARADGAVDILFAAHWKLRLHPISLRIEAGDERREMELSLRRRFSSMLPPSNAPEGSRLRRRIEDLRLVHEGVSSLCEVHVLAKGTDLHVAHVMPRRVEEPSSAPAIGFSDLRAWLAARAAQARLASPTREAFEPRPPRDPWTTTESTSPPTSTI